MGYLGSGERLGVEFHEERRADATFVLHHVKDPMRFGIVMVGPDNRILEMIEKPKPKEAEPYKVDNAFLGIAGLMILTPEILDFTDRTAIGRQAERWPTDSLQLAAKSGHRVYGFQFKGV
jgi:dTDP-glucose pyrophosphorylase